MLHSLRQGKQVSTFAPLVLGIRQYQNKNYASAVPLLCAGTQELIFVLTGQSAFGDPAFLARSQDLVKKMKEITDTAIREARRMPGSPYTLLSPGRDGTFVCPQ